MGYEAIAESIADAERAAVAAGVPAAVAATILLRAEADLVKAAIASDRAERQLLLDLREKGATQLARERGKSRSWVYTQRQKSLNKLSNFPLPELTAA